MNKLDRDYQNLLSDILNNGIRKKYRVDTERISVFGRELRHNMNDGFPLLTTRQLAWKSMVTELLWFLKGDTNLKYLADNNCHFWDDNAYKHYLNKTRFLSSGDWGKWVKNEHNEFGHPEVLTQEEFIQRVKDDSEFAEKYADLGPIYGAQWRKWRAFSVEYDIPKLPIDQIKNLIKELQENPDSTRLLVNAWNPGELYAMSLPPCHYGFQVWTRELSQEERITIYVNKFFPGLNLTNDPDWNLKKLEIANIPTRAISLRWNQRSVDTPLGLAMNIPSYALLLMLIGKQVNMVPEELSCNLGDTHIYSDQVAGVIKQLGRDPFDLPIMKISDKKVDDISEYTLEDFTLENYNYHPKIKFPLST